jgi:hypothetical protein
LCRWIPKLRASLSNNRSPQGGNEFPSLSQAKETRWHSRNAKNAAKK